MTPVRQGDGWYYEVRKGVEIGPFATAGKAMIAEACYKAGTTEPKPGQRYRHANGAEYAVIAVANDHSDNLDYQPFVVYQGDNGHIWSKPIQGFLDRMTLVPLDTVEHKISDRGPVEVSFLDAIGFKVTITEALVNRDYLYIGYGFSEQDIMMARDNAGTVAGYLLHFAKHGSLPDEPL